MGPGVVSRVACTKVADWIENIWLPSAIEVDAFDYEAPCVSAVPLPEVSPTDNPEDNSKFQEFATFWQNAVLGDAWFQWAIKWGIKWGITWGVQRGPPSWLCPDFVWSLVSGLWS